MGGSGMNGRRAWRRRSRILCRWMWRLSGKRSYDVSSFGSTEEEALANLREAVELYLEDLPGERSPVISQLTVGELAVA